MAQFRVHELKDGQLVLDLQSDVTETGTRLIAPLTLFGSGPTPIRILEPVFQLGAGDLVLRTSLAAAVGSRFIKPAVVVSLAAEEDRIRRARDLLLSGI